MEKNTTRFIVATTSLLKHLMALDLGIANSLIFKIENGILSFPSHSTKQMLYINDMQGSGEYEYDIADVINLMNILKCVTERPLVLRLNSSLYIDELMM